MTEIDRPLGNKNHKSDLQLVDEIYVSPSDINTGNSCKATFIKKVSYNSFQKTPIARSEKSVTEIGRPHDKKT